MLGAAVIIYESVMRLGDPPELQSLGVGIAVITLSLAVNLGVSGWLYRQARVHDSPALEGDAAHLRTDALTSVGVLVGLILVQVTGINALDPAVALAVAVAIVFSGVRIVARSSRVLVDEALPPEEQEEIRAAIEDHGAPEILGFHKLRDAARRAATATSTCTCSSARAPASSARTRCQHELSTAIARRLKRADVLIHLEPEDTSATDAPAEAARQRDGAGDEPPVSAG